jgi:hypothetical protein
MLKTPTMAKRWPADTTLDVAVGIDDDGFVYLTVDIDPRNLTRAWRSRTQAITDILDELRQRVRVGPAKHALLDEIDRLDEQLGSLADSVDVSLDAEQARALAAALTHYADETERPR